MCRLWLLRFFCKQKTAYEMRISDWSSDVCSSDLFTAEYREGPLVVVVEIESGGNQFISFSRKAFERWSNSSSPISPPAQERMLKNFMAALEFQGLVGVP